MSRAWIGLLATGGALASTVPIVEITGSSLNGTGVVFDGTAVVLSAVDTHDVSEGHWQRRLWEGPVDEVWTTQLDLGAWSTSTWVDLCVDDVDFDGTGALEPLGPFVESVDDQAWWVATTPGTAADLFDVHYPGQITGLAAPGARSLPALSGVAGARVVVADTMAEPLSIRFLTGGARVATGPLDYTVSLEFEDPAAPGTPVFVDVVVPIEPDDVVHTSQSVLDEAGVGVADDLTIQLEPWSSPATGAPGALCAGLAGDLVEIPNPATLVGHPVEGLLLRSIGVDYAELDPTVAPAPHLGGPLALSLELDSSQYEASWRWHATASTADTGASVIASAEPGWWYAVEWSVDSWPDAYSDLFVWARCSADPAGSDFSGQPWVSLTPLGLRDIAGFDTTGALPLPTACEGSHLQVQVELAASFATSPRLTGMAGLHDADADGDGITVGGLVDATGTLGTFDVDCDDQDGGVGPGQADVAGEGIDRDCDGMVLCFEDGDGDGDGTSNTLLIADVAGCDVAAQGASDNADDCDDADAGSTLFNRRGTRVAEVVGLGLDRDCDGFVPCFVDADGDGDGVPGSSIAHELALGASCTAPGVAAVDSDCDDGVVETSGLAQPQRLAETPAEAIDRDCDGQITCWVDSDDDGAGGANTLAVADDGSDCDRTGAQTGSSATSSTGGDCFDTLPDRFPGAEEPLGTTSDLNCDGALSCFADVDGDLFGAGLQPVPVNPGGSGTCDRPGLDASGNGGDCDDHEGLTFPGATEALGGGIDRNCDGVVQCFRDDDGDGFGVELEDVPVVDAVVGCASSGHAAVGGDCLDCDGVDCLDPVLRALSAGVNPGPVVEIVGNLYDDDCSGEVACFVDADGDGYGTETGEVTSRTVVGDVWGDGCDHILVSSTDDDCHDGEPAAHPGATEVPGNVYDDDCTNGPLCLLDLDGDGYAGAPNWDDLTWNGTAWERLPVSGAPSTVPWGGCLTGEPGCADPRGPGEDYLCDPARNEAHTPAGDYDCYDHPTLGGDIHPDQVETDGSGTDSNCDGEIICFVDGDGDGYGGTASPLVVLEGHRPGWLPNASGDALLNLCDGPGFTSGGLDCHDDVASANPDASEQIGNAYDDDCDGSFSCWRDRDGDGVGAGSVSIPGPAQDCDTVTGMASLGGDPGEGGFDCHDANAAAFPGASDAIGSAYDGDCDNRVLCYVDGDDDGYADVDQIVEIGVDWAVSGNVVLEARYQAAWTGEVFDCDAVPGLTAGARDALGQVLDDCHDTNPDAFPGALEIDGAGLDDFAWDEDCDGTVTCYRDLDGDGYGTEILSLDITDSTTATTIAPLAAGAFTCTQGDWSGLGGDCHDNEATANPLGAEVAGDVFDNDCDGSISCFEDIDKDGYGTALVPTSISVAVSTNAPGHEGVVDAAARGLRVYPCDEAAALAAGLVIDTTLSNGLAQQRLSSLGGPGTSQFDCHDDWAGAHPGVVEVVGDPFDNDCDGSVSCFVDLDADGFGSGVQTLEVRDALDVLLPIDFGFDDEFTYAFPLAGQLVRWPLDEVVADHLAQTTSAESLLLRSLPDTTTWYDCQQVPDGAVVGLGEWEDCHDDSDQAWPAFEQRGDERVRLTLEDHPLVGPGRPVCDGPALCVVGSDILGEDVDCGALGGESRCFATVLDDARRDPGERPGDALDNDCDSLHLCYEDQDEDGVGTLAIVDDGDGLCVTAGEAAYTGDCHDDAADVAPPASPLVSPGGDLSEGLSLGQPGPTAYDDASCPGVVFCVDGSTVLDVRSAPVCGGELRCFPEVAGDAYDQGCDGVVACLADADGDGFGADVAVVAPGGRQPGAANDGGLFVCADPVAGTADNSRIDCDDGDAEISPGSPESLDPLGGDPTLRDAALAAIGNDLDEDCDGQVLCFVDADGDGFGAGAAAIDLATMTPSDLDTVWNGRVLPYEVVAAADCSAPNLAAVAGDCDDGDASVNPDAVDAVGDALDANCDGVWSCYEDLDDDGFGSDLETVHTEPRACIEVGESAESGDCLDSDASTFPGGPEIYGDGIDGNCDGEEICFADVDGDGFAAGADVGSVRDPLGRFGTLARHGASASEKGRVPCDGPGELDDGTLVPTTGWPASVLLGGDDPFTSVDGLAIFDCNDLDGAVFPGAVDEPEDGIDSNCDNRSDFDGDLDGFDRAGVARDACQPDLTTVDPVRGCGPGLDHNDGDGARYRGVFDRSLEALAAVQARDDFSTGPVERVLASDGRVITGIPSRREVCETSDQLDDDGDGNPNSSWTCWFDYWDWSDDRELHRARQVAAQRPWGSFPRDPYVHCDPSDPEGVYDVEPTQARAATFYRDRDGDAYGDDSVPAVVLCDADFEDTVWIEVGEDCDDRNHEVAPNSREICDGVDNNCNDEADEYSNAVGQSPQDGDDCVLHYIDRDQDGFGDQTVGAEPNPGLLGIGLCLCPSLEPSEECITEAGEGFYELNNCFVADATDCDDNGVSIHPRLPGEPLVEILDGVDNNCDGLIPLVEIDCDGDGALPFLPSMSAELLNDPRKTPIRHADDVGLSPCVVTDEEVLVDCGEASLQLVCDTGTNLWAVRTGVLDDEGLLDGARTTSRPESGAWDCDDACPTRRTGLAETCDGTDNDCDAFRAAALANHAGNSDATDRALLPPDRDGFPDALVSDAAPLGAVEAAELDLDGDVHLTCDPDDVDLADAQDVLTARGCPVIEGSSDCDDLCSLTSPGAEETACNGFASDMQCAPTRAFEDDDGDGYLTCGMYGAEELEERIYILALIDGDPADYDAIPRPEGRVLPLVEPRRFEGGNWTDSSADGQIRPCDNPLAEAQSRVLGDLPREGWEAHALGHCMRAQTCRELRASHEALYGEVTPVDEDGSPTIPRDGQAPAPPIDGAGLVPDWCTDELADDVCLPVELTLSDLSDADLYDGAVWPADGCVFDEGGKLLHPEEAVTRTVWNRQRIVDAREMVVDWECFRMFGTAGCGASASESEVQAVAGTLPYNQPPTSGGYFQAPSVVDEAFTTDDAWWLTMGRYGPTAVHPSDTLVGCWGDPREVTARSGSTLQEVGGDCAVGDEEAHRGIPEGPGDVLGWYEGLTVSCGTCVDGIDNNCDGRVDQDDPACSQCFVGWGFSCACESGSGGPPPGSVWFVVAALVGLRRRRE